MHNLNRIPKESQHSDMKPKTIQPWRTAAPSPPAPEPTRSAVPREGSVSGAAVTSGGGGGSSGFAGNSADADAAAHCRRRRRLPSRRRRLLRLHQRRRRRRRPAAVGGGSGGTNVVVVGCVGRRRRRPPLVALGGGGRRANVVVEGGGGRRRLRRRRRRRQRSCPRWRQQPWWCRRRLCRHIDVISRSHSNHGNVSVAAVASAHTLLSQHCSRSCCRPPLLRPRGSASKTVAELRVQLRKPSRQGSNSC